MAPVSLQIQTGKITWRNYKWGQAKVVTGAWNRRKYVVEKKCQTNVLFL